MAIRSGIRGMRGLAATVAILLVGCTTRGPSEPPAPTRLYPEGTYRHAFIGLEFPERTASFERAYVTEYDPQKANVSGHYWDRSVPVAATSYVYPATDDASRPTRQAFLDHFGQARADVERATPQAKEMSAGPTRMKINGFELAGLHARFQLPPAGQSGTLDSHLDLFPLDGWYLKFRFSHPWEAREEAIESEREFIRSVRWPVPGRDEPPH
jgi:hypothetical protein